MNTRSHVVRRNNIAWAIALIVLVAFLAALVALRSNAYIATATDVDDITSTIKAAFLLRADACRFESHEEQEQYLSQLEDYWSADAPSGDDLATRQASWSSTFATPNATARALDKEIDITNHSEGLISTDTLNSLLAPITYPTPDWLPDDSPLELAQGEIKYCQEDSNGTRPVLIDYQVHDFDFDVNVIGDSATVTMTVGYAEELTWPGSTSSEGMPDSREKVFMYFLSKENGVWKIRKERPIFARTPS